MVGGGGGVCDFTGAGPFALPVQLPFEESCLVLLRCVDDKIPRRVECLDCHTQVIWSTGTLGAGRSKSTCLTVFLVRTWLAARPFQVARLGWPLFPSFAGSLRVPSRLAELWVTGAGRQSLGCSRSVLAGIPYVAQPCRPISPPHLHMKGTRLNGIVAIRVRPSFRSTSLLCNKALR